MCALEGPLGALGADPEEPGAAEAYGEPVELESGDHGALLKDEENAF